MNQRSRDEERNDGGRTGRGRRGEERGGMPAPDRGERDLGPFTRMSRLSREIDRMFEGLWRSPLGLLADRGGRGHGGNDPFEARWIPDLEMHEHDGEFLVRVDLPGMRKEDVDVEVVGQSLVIQGERRQGCESDENGWHHSECRYGSFVRTVPLPENVDPEQIRAEFHDGILELRMPSPARAESRRRIHVGEGRRDAEGAGARGRSGPSRGTPDVSEST